MLSFTHNFHPNAPLGCNHNGTGFVPSRILHTFLSVLQCIQFKTMNIIIQKWQPYSRIYMFTVKESFGQFGRRAQVRSERMITCSGENANHSQCGAYYHELCHIKQAIY